jgi:hypothetical protein
VTRNKNVCDAQAEATLGDSTAKPVWRIVRVLPQTPEMVGEIVASVPELKRMRVMEFHERENDKPSVAFHWRERSTKDELGSSWRERSIRDKVEFHWRENDKSSVAVHWRERTIRDKGKFHWCEQNIEVESNRLSIRDEVEFH